MKVRLLLSAAEPSGDRLAADLVAAMRTHADVDAFGLAGPAMRAAGVEALARAEDLAVMGVVEIAAKMRAVRHARSVLAARLDEGGFDAFVWVDAPELHLPLSRRARARGRRAVGVVAPQVWAWRPGRAPKVASSVDMLLCLFAFEPALFPGTDARWMGHPAVERVPARAPVDPLFFTLCPGSRPQEVDAHTPVFLEVAGRVSASLPGARFALLSLTPKQPTLPANVALATSLSEIAGARAALTKSGTVTLELAAMGIPMVVAHRVHPVTLAVGRALVRGVRHIALPNVLTHREVVPEHLGARLDPDVLARDLLALPAHQDVDLSAARAPGSVDRGARAILEAVA